jgi:hypothetical protein
VDNGMKLIVKKFELSAFFVLGSSHTLLPGTGNRSKLFYFQERHQKVPHIDQSVQKAD